MTLDDFWALCVGEIGMSPESYLASTWREILCTIHGYRKRVRDQAREGWRHARIIAYYAVVPHVKGGSIRKPEDLFRLDGDADQQNEAQVISDNDLRDLNIPADARINYKSDLSKKDWEEKAKLILTRRKITKEGKNKKKNNAKPR